MKDKWKAGSSRSRQRSKQSLFINWKNNKNEKIIINNPAVYGWAKRIKNNEKAVNGLTRGIISVFYQAQA